MFAPTPKSKRDPIAFERVAYLGGERNPPERVWSMTSDSNLASV